MKAQATTQAQIWKQLGTLVREKLAAISIDATAYAHKRGVTPKRASQLFLGEDGPRIVRWDNDDILAVVQLLKDNERKLEAEEMQAMFRACHTYDHGGWLPPVHVVTNTPFSEAHELLAHDRKKIEQNAGATFVQAEALHDALIYFANTGATCKRLRDILSEAYTRLPVAGKASRLYRAVTDVRGESMPFTERSLETILWWLAIGDLFSVPANLDGLRLPPTYETWKQIEQTDYIYNSELNQKLASDGLKLPIRCQSESFTTTQVSDLAAGYALRRVFEHSKQRAYNGHKIRLCQDLTAVSTEVVVQQGVYYGMIATNELAGEIVENSSATVTFDGRTLFSLNGKVLSLQESHCENHLGAATLAVTTDGVILIHEQTAENVISGGQLVPSGAGSLDWADLKECDDFRDLAIRGALRELREEAGIAQEELAARTRIVGFGLRKSRGMIPGVFCVSFLRQSSSQVRSLSEEEYVGFYRADLHLNLSNIDAATETIGSVLHGRSLGGKDLSAELLAHLFFFRTWLLNGGRVPS